MILSLGAILLSVLLAPMISTRIKVPVIVIEVLLGVLLGKSALNVVAMDPWIEFFAYFGLVYLLFLAGLEIDVSKALRSVKAVAAVALGSLLMPFILGYLLGLSVGVDPMFMGTVLSTTSLGVVLPLSKELGRGGRFTDVLLGATVLVDIASMVLLTVILGVRSNALSYLYFTSLSLFMALFSIPLILRKTGVSRAIERWESIPSHFQFEVRACLALIGALALLSEILGVHSILGAFLAGMIISGVTERGGELEGKLMGFGYGFLVPFFFIIVGANVDLRTLIHNVKDLTTFAGMMAFGIFGKIAGVSLPNKVFGFTVRESIAMGFMKSARLSLVLAAAELGRGLGLLTSSLYSMLVLFSLISVLLGPSVGMGLLKKEKPSIKYFPPIPEEFWEL